jgi:hypothetical protein
MRWNGFASVVEGINTLGLFVLKSVATIGHFFNKASYEYHEFTVVKDGGGISEDPFHKHTNKKGPEGLAPGLTD